MSLLKITELEAKTIRLEKILTERNEEILKLREHVAFQAKEISKLMEKQKKHGKI